MHVSRYVLRLAILGAIAVFLPAVQAVEMPVEEAWKALPQYEYGQDMAALLTVDRAVIEAARSPQARAACAARLAAVLVSERATAAAKQYVCLKLRDVGTAAEVPLLAKLLEQPQTSQIARYALEAIPGPEAAAALRAALTKLEGQELVGVINSIAARRDVAALPTLEQLADSPDGQVASAAIWALGNLGDQRAVELLIRRAHAAGKPLPQQLAVPLLRSAYACLESDRTETARAIFQQLSQPGQPAGVRRAALEGLLRLQDRQALSTIVEWFTKGDADQQLVASEHLSALPEEIGRAHV